MLSSGERKSNRIWILVLALLAAGLTALCLCLPTRELAGAAEDVQVYISEVLGANTAFPSPDGTPRDFIELYNPGETPADLSGWALTDDPGKQTGRYVFPEGSLLAPGAYLAVWCSPEEPGGIYAPFGVSREGGETICLCTPSGDLADSVETLPTGDNQSLLFAPGIPAVLCDCPTPGTGAAEAPARLRLSELMSSNSGFPGPDGICWDWIELENAGADRADLSGWGLSDSGEEVKYVFPAGTVLAPGDFLLVWCDPEGGADCAPFGLNREGGERIFLRDGSGYVRDSVETLPLEKDQALAREGAAWTVTSAPTPGFPNTPEGRQAYLATVALPPGPVLSELMADNSATLADGEGDFPDWAELHNPTGLPVDLTGWGLSDDPENPGKWSFPETVLGPGEYRTVFLSGKDREGHANFSLSAGGEALVLSTPEGRIADRVEFGPLARDVSLVRTAEGTAVCEQPTPGFENSEEGYEAFCRSHTPAGPLAIWEAMVSNDALLPQNDGRCYDWAELRNLSDEALDLSVYRLADGGHSFPLPQRTLAPGESMTVILSGKPELSDARALHAPFSLSAVEDRLYLYGPEGLADYALLRGIPNQYSLGRRDRDSGFLYMLPTPGTENGEGWRMVSAAPVASAEPGVLASDGPVTIAFDAPGAVRYTLDGSVPGEDAAEYTGPVTVETTAVLRAAAFEEGKLPSRIWTALMLVDEPHEIPVLSLAVDPAELAKIYRPSWEIKGIEKEANLAYLGTDGSFALDCGITMHGATSLLAQDKKSFTLKFRNNYDGPLRYDLFEDGKITDFASLVLRADQESTYSSYLRDNLFAGLASEYSEHLLSQNYKHVALYLNGTYWGIYALREHHSEEYYASHENVSADSVTMIRFLYSTGNLRRVMDAAQGGVFSPEEYAYAATVLDLESFADWIIFEAYCGNADINGNMRYYYSTEDGLWRCGLTDVDLGMFSPQTFDAVTGAGTHGTIPEALLHTPGARELIAERLAWWLSGPMSDEAMIARIDAMAAVIREEVTLEKERWGGSVHQWELMVETLKDYCDGRAAVMIDSFCAAAGFSAQERAQYFP